MQTQANAEGQRQKDSQIHGQCKKSGQRGPPGGYPDRTCQEVAYQARWQTGEGGGKSKIGCDEPGRLQFMLPLRAHAETD